MLAGTTEKQSYATSYATLLLSSLTLLIVIPTLVVAVVSSSSLLSFPAPFFLTCNIMRPRLHSIVRETMVGICR